MFSGGYHPKAVLLRIRNTKRGLEIRTHILNLLERGNYTIREISDITKLYYSQIIRQIHHLEKEMLVRRSERKPYIWTLTGLGQSKLF